MLSLLILTVANPSQPGYNHRCVRFVSVRISGDKLYVVTESYQRQAAVVLL
jgi:hypothetical protein